MIIGAQKAGTTSVTSYLQEHPDLYIPKEKELPFFSDLEMFEKGEEWFLDSYFASSEKGHLLGTASPQYMLYPDCFSRIVAYRSDVKLIALLRDPIRRLISHYDMAVRISYEKRSLNEAVEQQLDDLERCRAVPFNNATMEKYVAGGEYGRILQELFLYCSREQLLVIDFQHLVADRQIILDQLYGFLGVESIAPKNIDTVQMRGGKMRRFNFDHNRSIAWGSALLRSYPFLNQIIPEWLRSQVRNASAWIDNVNVDPNSKSTDKDLSPELRCRLEKLYMEDKERLGAMGYSVSWDYGDTTS